MARSPDEMIAQICEGLAVFGVTPFDARDRFDEAGFRAHCARLASRGMRGFFAAGGTGEFFSLSREETASVIAAAVSELSHHVPVIAGCGYGTRLAIEYAELAERAGADGILLMPPYLIQGEQSGLFQHARAVCRSTRLGVILYSRANGIYSADTLARLADECPNLTAVKDGVGDVEQMQAVLGKVRGRLRYISGMPTAETYALAHLAAGVDTYSSGIYNFLPDWAVRFFNFAVAGDETAVATELERFVLPYVALRNRSAGYAVAIVKAGVRAIGSDVGRVRPPLADLTEDEQAALTALVTNVAGTNRDTQASRVAGACLVTGA